MQRINCDSRIESHLINARSALNKITGVAQPEQVTGLLRQAFAAGVANILEGKKPKSSFAKIGENLVASRSESTISALAVVFPDAQGQILLNCFHSILNKLAYCTLGL